MTCFRPLPIATGVAISPDSKFLDEEYFSDDPRRAVLGAAPAVLGNHLRLRGDAARDARGCVDGFVVCRKNRRTRTPPLSVAARSSPAFEGDGRWRVRRTPHEDIERGVGEGPHIGLVRGPI